MQVSQLLSFKLFFNLKIIIFIKFIFGEVWFQKISNEIIKNKEKTTMCLLHINCIFLLYYNHSYFIKNKTTHYILQQR